MSSAGILVTFLRN